MIKSSNKFYFIVGILWGCAAAPSVYHHHFIDFLKSSHLAVYAINDDGHQMIHTVDVFSGQSCIVFYAILVLLLAILYLLDEEKNIAQGKG